MELHCLVYHLHIPRHRNFKIADVFPNPSVASLHHTQCWIMKCRNPPQYLHCTTIPFSHCTTSWSSTFYCTMLWWKTDFCCATMCIHTGHHTSVSEAIILLNPYIVPHYLMKCLFQSCCYASQSSTIQSDCVQRSLKLHVSILLNLSNFCTMLLDIFSPSSNEDKHLQLDILQKPISHIKTISVIYMLKMWKYISMFPK